MNIPRLINIILYPSLTIVCINLLLFTNIPFFPKIYITVLPTFLMFVFGWTYGHIAERQGGARKVFSLSAIRDLETKQE